MAALVSTLGNQTMKYCSPPPSSFFDHSINLEPFSTSALPAPYSAAPLFPPNTPVHFCSNGNFLLQVRGDPTDGMSALIGLELNWRWFAWLVFASEMLRRRPVDSRLGKSSYFLLLPVDRPRLFLLLLFNCELFSDDNGVDASLDPSWLFLHQTGTLTRRPA